ncbi:sulfatase-like hydrolase/transferase [Fodinisporobacter ferrooxydans]|uniref:Sulfatase-like hydrolase/transferase n=1 Tax=Fodinisporobacter ferrooxydans TaxID=2901836 RepID=A0ABY4CEA1_9BACL|nr:sulfatase-like hydrolase/transferase [Alicyclobacillaceae bacterium MYW30-H2]
MKVIYLDIDSLRPDHLGVYGYPRPTSPNIDKLAREGIFFTHCFASDSPCMPSRAATISGTLGIKNGIVTHGDRGLVLNPNTPTLPQLLRENNIKTAAISTFGRHPSPWFYVGWETFLDPTGWDFQTTPGWKIHEYASQWIEENVDDDFVLWVQFWDPHAVYDAPQGCVEAVRNEKFPAYPTRDQIETFQGDKFWHSAPMMGIYNYEDYQKVVNEYDGEIRYVDYHIGKLIEKLESLHILDDTLIIVSADHGEELGEHGVFIEHWSTFNGTNRVPLIMRYPKKIPAGMVSHELIYQMDLSSTILQYFNIETPSEWDSKSLWTHINTTSLGEKSGRLYLVIGHGLYTAQRAVVTHEWKLIRTYHSGQWILPEIQLYNLLEDPFEQKDVSQDHPDVVRMLIGYLNEWEYLNQSASGTDPMKRNAEQGPPGIELYGKQSMENFLRNSQPMITVRTDRKPEVELY